jgi:hypothetical protein
MELYPAFRVPVPGAEFAVEGCSLARDIERLDRLANLTARSRVANTLS